MSNKQLVNDILEFDINKAPPTQDTIDHAVSLVRKRLARIRIIDNTCIVIMWASAMSLLAIPAWGIPNTLPQWMIGMTFSLIVIVLVVGSILIKSNGDIRKLTNQIYASKPSSTDRLKKLLELLSERPEYLIALGDLGRTPVEGEVSKFIDLLEASPLQGNYLSLCRKVCGFDDEAEFSMKNPERDQHNACQ